MEELRGVIERFVFRNEQTGYAVLRLVLEGRQQTAVGVIDASLLGQEVELTGEWVTHRQYGRQFEFGTAKPLSPMNVAGLEKYLGSGIIRGVGPQTARRIVEHFGPGVVSVLENDPERVREVAGIGGNRASLVAEAFAKKSSLREAMVFLQGHGISPGYAGRIYRQYGENCEKVLRDNPYRVADDVHGIGFKTADRLATEMGLAANDPRRIASGLRYTLLSAEEQGHCYLPRPILVERCCGLLSVNADLIEGVLEGIIRRRLLVAGTVRGELRVYRSEFWHAESSVAEKVKGLLRRGMIHAPVVDEELAQFEGKNNMVLAREQREAVRSVLQSGLAIVTGGPGTGKTTLIRALLHIAGNRQMSVALAAPTGRAARRMSESTGHQARTLHRLLEYSVQDGLFQRNSGNPLPCDMLVVDEASMVDLRLMASLLQALPPHCVLVLVGDVDQLPPVGAGSVLSDLIASGLVPSVRLHVIYRQAEESAIVHNAHRINRGEFPVLKSAARDFIFIKADDPEQAAQLVIDAAVNRLPRSRRLHPIDDIQVLSPMRRSITGVEALNHQLQSRLNPASPNKPEISLGERVIRLGDKVMQIKNNYAKMVFNGDVGRVVDLDTDEGVLTVLYNDAEANRRVRYEFSELDELVTAYAISVHKSQGSEYRAVVLPFTTQHFMMLQRNLLYTAITRARELVVLVGSGKAIAIAIKNATTQERYSGLQDHLHGAYGTET